MKLTKLKDYVDGKPEKWTGEIKLAALKNERSKEKLEKFMKRKFIYHKRLKKVIHISN